MKKDLENLKKSGKALAGLLFALLVVSVFLRSGESDAPPTRPAIGPADVEVEEIALDGDGLGQEATLTRNLYFVIDGSGSMDDAPTSNCRGDQAFETKMDGARWAVERFLETVPPDVNLGLYIFDESRRGEVLPLAAGQHDAFLTQVQDIDPGRGTPLAQAIEAATDQLVDQYRAQLGYGEFRIVVVTDGRAEEIDRAGLYATRHGMPIYAIGLCIGQNHPLRNWAVSYQAADSFEDLARGLEQTLAELPSFDVEDFEALDLEEAGDATQDEPR